MKVPLIYFLVMILRYAMSFKPEDIVDLSNWCTNGRTISFYLTSGAGFSDISVAMIASENHINCDLTFKVKARNYIMVVVELPDQMPSERICFSRTNNSVLIRDYNDKYICQDDGKKSLYYGLSQDTMSLSISSEGLMNTVKITSTSMRDGTYQKCSNSDEIVCVYNDKVFCMTSETLCDGHNNCGVFNDYDESSKKCEGFSLNFYMIISFMIMLLLTSGLIVSVALVAIPSRKEIFIYAYEESSALFDCDDEIIKSEIHIQELKPIDDEENEKNGL